MSNLLTRLYKNIALNKPYTNRVNINYLYEQVLEQGGFNFGPDNLYNQRIPWTPFQARFYNEKFNNATTGPGEGSVAAVLIKYSKENPNEPEGTTQTDIDNITRVVNHPGAETVDLQSPIPGSNYFYEVKQIGKGVMVGVESSAPAANVYDKVRADFKKIYTDYKRLSPEHKKLLEQFGPKPKFNKLNKFYSSLEEIMECGNEYFSKPGELARGSVLPTKTGGGACKLWLIPRYFNEEFLTHPTVERDVPWAVDLLKDIYNTDIERARYIDKMARDFVSFQKTGRPSDAFPAANSKVALSDFILVTSFSVFASRETFKEQVQAYFMNGEPECAEQLRKIFPNTGLFDVSPEGWMYAGINRLPELIGIQSITKSRFKIARRDDLYTPTDVLSDLSDTD